MVRIMGMTLVQPERRRKTPATADHAAAMEAPLRKPARSAAELAEMPPAACTSPARASTGELMNGSILGGREMQALM
jgi:hypothetical protein